MARSKGSRVWIAGGLALTALMMSREASAAPSLCTTANTYVLSAAGGYGGTFDVAGTTLTPDAATGAYTCIQQQDKIFSNFSLSGLPSPGSAVMNFATIGGVDTHSISFSANYLVAGSPYTFSYNIEIDAAAVPLPRLVESSSDMVQTAGEATLDETLVSNLGATYSIQFTKTGSSGYSGNNDVGFGTVTEWLDVANELTLDAGGTNVSVIENSFVQDVPEPTSLMLVGGGMLWIGLAGLAKEGRLGAGALASRQTAKPNFAVFVPQAIDLRPYVAPATALDVGSRLSHVPYMFTA